MKKSDLQDKKAKETLEFRRKHFEKENIKMMSNPQFWNSITYSSEEYKKKYESDKKFWKDAGEQIYQRMIEREAKNG